MTISGVVRCRSQALRCHHYSAIKIVHAESFCPHRGSAQPVDIHCVHHWDPPSSGKNKINSLSSDHSWFAKLHLSWHCVFFHSLHLFCVSVLFVYSSGVLKYSIVSTITVELPSVLGNIKDAHCMVWCEPCQDKQTWHLKQGNESLLLSHQNKSGKH